MQTIKQGARVFIIEKPQVGKDVSTAEQYGKLVTIFDFNARRPSVFHPTEYVEQVIRRLKECDFDPTNDMILLCGALLPTSLLLTAVVNEFKEVRVLMFSSHESMYVEKTIRV